MQSDSVRAISFHRLCSYRRHSFPASLSAQAQVRSEVVTAVDPPRGGLAMPSSLRGIVTSNCTRGPRPLYLPV